ncbi:hypothetical protein TNCV_623611 [Trichonephila clavipes]|nr:hypothetical protein TNCV_623611 [Trichonephila clavipes]
MGPGNSWSPSQRSIEHSLKTIDIEQQFTDLTFKQQTSHKQGTTLFKSNYSFFTSREPKQLFTDTNLGRKTWQLLHSDELNLPPTKVSCETETKKVLMNIKTGNREAMNM